MHEYARHLVASTAAQVLPCRGSSTKAAIARQFLPYCLSPVGDGYILLNREYKPLGWPTRLRGRVDYGDPMFASMVVAVDRDAVSTLHSAKSHDGQFFYLYGGSGSIPAPWTDSNAAAFYLCTIKALFGLRSISREGAEA